MRRYLTAEKDGLKAVAMGRSNIVVYKGSHPVMHVSFDRVRTQKDLFDAIDEYLESQRATV